MKTLIKKDIIGVMQYAVDLERASRWYCDNLGFTIGHHNFNSFVELMVDNQYVMHLLITDKVVPSDKATFTFDTTDIEAAHKSLLERKVEVGPILAYSDHKAFSFKDCEGNALMICQFFN